MYAPCGRWNYELSYNFPRGFLSISLARNSQLNTKLFPLLRPDCIDKFNSTARFINKLLYFKMPIKVNVYFRIWISYPNDW